MTTSVARHRTVPLRARHLVLPAAVLGAQLAHTVLDRNRWPFCSNNMFNRALPRRFEQFRVRLRDDEGWTGLLDVYGLLPLEFFRIVETFDQVYVAPRVSQETRRRFTRELLSEMNENPWRRFDEIHPPPVPRSGRWLDLKAYVVWVDLDDFDAEVGAPLHAITECFHGLA